MAKKRKKAQDQTDKFFEAEKRIELEARNFFDRNGKIITGITAGIFALIALGYGYKQLVKIPKEIKAQDMMVQAQHYFEQDSFNLALNGDGVTYGFKEVINKYSGTNAGNGARLYAGISSLHLGEYENAISYLEKFKTDDNILNARKNGMIGDAKAELGDLNSAISYYSKAVQVDEHNIITAPFYLYKLAMAQNARDQTSKAVETLEKLVSQFPGEHEIFDAEKELARLQASTK